MYNILEARLFYKDNKLHCVTVLVEISKGDVRAIFSTTDMRGGYDCLTPDEPVNSGLLQRVAAYGMQSANRDKIFPNWKKKYNESKW